MCTFVTQDKRGLDIRVKVKENSRKKKKKFEKQRIRKKKNHAMRLHVKPEQEE